MNVKKLLRKAAYEIVSQKPVEKVTIREILEIADVSRQTFYRNYTDKYALVNEIYYDLTNKGIVEPEAVNSLESWHKMYLMQFAAYRKHLDFVRHLFSSRETGCTLEFEIQQTLEFDKALLKKNGADLNDGRILFALEAKDIGGTNVMADWIIGGMKTDDDEMVIRFELVIPEILRKYMFC